MTYPEAVVWLQSLTRLGIKPGLERMEAMLSELGLGSLVARGALVAGTNGKGSTVAFLESILRAAGRHTGTAPTPHLRSYTERIAVDGRPLSEARFAEVATSLRERLRALESAEDPPTEFETVTAMAIDHLQDRCDRLLIEVGMGGTLDATNVLDLGVAVITNVTRDHARHLGDTVADIAAAKAGIIKPRNIVVTAAAGEALEVIEREALRQGARLWRLGREISIATRAHGWSGSEFDIRGPGFEWNSLRIHLVGSFQPVNAALAVAAAHALGDATEAAVREGLSTARWPGRMDLREGVLLDGGHNEEGLQAIVADLRELAPGRRLVVLFGAMRDKELSPMLAQLANLEPVSAVFTEAAAAGSRAAPAALLAGLWEHRPVAVVKPASSALARARAEAGEGGLVLVCGSLHLVAELMDRV